MKKKYSKILKSNENLAVDANPIISALLGGAASRVFWSSQIKQFTTAAYTIDEVKHYLPRLAAKAGVDEKILLLSLQLLPIKIRSKTFYAGKIMEAKMQIAERDPKDVDLLALALKLGIPIWSNDRDFQTTQVTVYTTAQLLTLLEL